MGAHLRRRPSSRPCALATSSRWALTAARASCDAAGGHWRPSVAVSGHRRPSEAISGHQRPTATNGDHRQPSAAIGAHRGRPTWLRSAARACLARSISRGAPEAFCSSRSASVVATASAVRAASLPPPFHSSLPRPRRGRAGTESPACRHASSSSSSSPSTTSDAPRHSNASSSTLPAPAAVTAIGKHSGGAQKALSRQPDRFG